MQGTHSHKELITTINSDYNHIRKTTAIIAVKITANVVISGDSRITPDWRTKRCMYIYPLL